MNSNRLAAIASRVIAQAGREHPADHVLRAELRKERALPRDQSRIVAQSVFAYYRWLQWLDPANSIAEQLEHANELDNRFNERPSEFADDDLNSKTVPAWTRDYMEISIDWLRAIQKPPIVWLRTRRGRRQIVSSILDDCEPHSRIADAAEYRGERDLFRETTFQSGEFEVQDISSQAVGLLCDPGPRECWWDCCAGEGGKTLHLAELMSGTGSVWATDRSEWRLAQLRRRAARSKIFNYRVALWDGSERLPTTLKFDGVLIDAPCSGIGTWHRNPHARWTTKPADVEELSRIQSSLLSHASSAVKSGGKLIYAVCTMARLETIEVVRHFEQTSADFEPYPVKTPFDVAAIPQATHWFLPQNCGGNGMFVAVWKRKSLARSKKKEPNKKAAPFEAA